MITQSRTGLAGLNPDRPPRLDIRSRIFAWMVKSKAVVGSSARTVVGLRLRAMIVAVTPRDTARILAAGDMINAPVDKYLLKIIPSTRLRCP